MFEGLLGKEVNDNTLNKVRAIVEEKTGFTTRVILVDTVYTECDRKDRYSFFINRRKDGKYFIEKIILG